MSDGFVTLNVEQENEQYIKNITIIKNILLEDIITTIKSRPSLSTIKSLFVLFVYNISKALNPDYFPDSTNFENINKLIKIYIDGYKSKDVYIHFIIDKVINIDKNNIQNDIITEILDSKQKDSKQKDTESLTKTNASYEDELKKANFFKKTNLKKYNEYIRDTNNYSGYYTDLKIKEIADKELNEYNDSLEKNYKELLLPDDYFENEYNVTYNGELVTFKLTKEYKGYSKYAKQTAILKFKNEKISLLKKKKFEEFKNEQKKHLNIRPDEDLSSYFFEKNKNIVESSKAFSKIILYEENYKSKIKLLIIDLIEKILNTKETYQNYTDYCNNIIDNIKPNRDGTHVKIEDIYVAFLSEGDLSDELNLKFKLLYLINIIVYYITLLHYNKKKFKYEEEKKKKFNRTRKTKIY
jgi:hypothetical protein